MGRKRIILIAAIIVLVFAGIYFFFVGEEQGEEINQSSEQITEVSRGNLEKTVSASGELVPLRERDLTAPGAGEVLEVYVEEGDSVEKGEKLIELDDKQQRLDYLQAKEALETARLEGSDREIERRELELEIAEDELDNRIIDAEISGTVTDVEVEKDDSVSGTDMLVRVMDFSDYEIEVGIDESDGRLVEVDQDAEIEFDAFPGEDFSGRVVDVKNRAELEGGVAELPVTVRVDERNSDFKTGYTADLEIIVEMVEDELLVPVTAVHRKEGKEFVYMLEEGEPERVPVETSLSDGMQTVVTDGLNEGDEILINVAGQTNTDDDEQSGFGPPGGGPGRGGF
ncbi:MAG: efflux RND transporter periplasmic adaptor subunit [Halanaerobiaceae bacterium]